MCRLLCVRSEAEFEIDEHLEPFTEIARTSREYQGHGWGCAWLVDNSWHFYHSIQPIWEDLHRPAGRTSLLIAHARSAFRDEGIVIENNMPFSNGERVFIFNGELRGVRINEEGRIGAEKIFNTILKFDRGNLTPALEKGLKVIERRTRYVRAMNIILATPTSIHVASLYNEDQEYFDMQITQNGERLAICSEAYPLDGQWESFGNRRIESFKC